jgi:hypothetical protein
MSNHWSDWLPFPDPRKGQRLIAPIGPGVYDLRLRSTGEPILFGIGGHAAARMTSLLPEPYGSGGRNNDGKRQFIFDNLADIEYRTMACATREEAAEIERKLPKGSYRFRT